MRKVIFLLLFMVAAYSSYRFNYWQMNFSVRKIIGVHPDFMTANSILVLPGSGRAYTERPNRQFNGRVQKAAELLDAYPDMKVIVSGLHDGAEYAETSDLAAALRQRGIAESRIIYDSSAYDTFQTILNLKLQDKSQNYIFVSQKEHLSRTLWMARQAGLSASGIIAPGWPGGTPQWRITRERLAAVKARFNLYYYRIFAKRFE